MSLLSENPSLREFVENQTVAFAMFCDQKLLTHDEGNELADALSDGVFQAADDREGRKP